MGKRRYVGNDEFENALKNEDNIKLIKWVTGKYANVLSQEDIEQAGLDGLWRALGYHRDGMGKKFTSNLCTFLHFECRRALSKNNRLSNHAVELPDNLPAKQENPEMVHLMECIESLPELDRKIICGYYLEKKPLNKLAKQHNHTMDDLKKQIDCSFKKLQTLCGV